MSPKPGNWLRECFQSMTFWRVTLVVTLLSCLVSLAAAPPVRHSQQFTVFDGRPVNATSPGPLKTKTGQPLLKLDADTLVVSAERVRLHLVGQLGLPIDAGGKIQLVLYPAQRPESLIGVTSVITPSGWEYRVDIPDQIEAQQLVRGVTHALLLEIANRGQGPKSAELPLWLVEGLTAQLLAVAGPELVVTSVPLGKMLRSVTERRGVDYLKDARGVLATNAPPAFKVLGRPTQLDLEGDRLKTYQAAAHLFVYELLHTKTGPTGIVQMLRQLPNCWNWETAFLKAYSTEFPRMLDVEKAWSITVLAFTARDPSQVWSKVVCLGRLDDVLTVTTQVRTSRDAIPQRTTISLREMLLTWDYTRHAPVVRQKLALLQAVRFNAPPEVLPLIEDYHRTLSAYLQKRSQAGRDPENRMQGSLSPVLVTQDAIRQLEVLDRQREAMRPENALSANSNVSN